VGKARQVVAKALEERRTQLEAERDARVIVEEAVDVTLPVDRTEPGALHPLEAITERITDVFVGMGWEVAEGPEVEAEWFNFDALNFDPDHPARQMQDTFFVEPPESGLVLRTHTSPVQVRALLERGVPDLRHLPRQGVPHGRARRHPHSGVPSGGGPRRGRGPDDGAPQGHPDHFARGMFGPGVRTRLRPSFFPFTEPSAELDVLCFVCAGKDLGCPTCKGTGWIEWGGCGMVHPNVLRAGGVDPDVYSGFAFGMGIERTLMFRHGVKDMHDIVEGDVRFSRHYGVEL
jgi:phenylalanyl-tRNA synthetase alpha chain